MNGGNGGGGSGLSDSSKKVIGGVVGGVGGAIVLGALALVAWRIWGRKKSTPEDDTLMGSGPPTLTHEKRTSGNDSVGYNDGLERYRDHGSQNVNTASNF